MAAAVKVFHALGVRIRRLIKGIAEWPTKQTWARRARASNWVLALEIGAVVGSAVGLFFAYLQFGEQVKVNKATALVHNWTLLTTRAPGNSGKVEAMEYLASRRHPLIGIDLSCEAMDGAEVDKQGESVCVRPTYLKSLNLSKAARGWSVSLKGANLSGAYLERANLSGAELSSINLSHANLEKAKLIGTTLKDVNLTEAILNDAELKGADLEDADLSDAKLVGADLRGVNFKDTVLLGADLTDTKLTNTDLRHLELIRYEPSVCQPKRCGP